MTKPVKKAVILAAGLGTRFLPMTKVIPKAMLPILNKPVIQYLVEEAIASGIHEIIIVTGSGKRTIEEHFDPSYELEHELKLRGKEDLLEEVQKLEKAARFVYVPQNEAKGDGHALLCAKELLDEEPFAVLFGDDIIDGPVPALAQLLKVYEETGTPVLCTERVPKERIGSYGVLHRLPRRSPHSSGLTRGKTQARRSPFQLRYYWKVHLHAGRPPRPRTRRSERGAPPHRRFPHAPRRRPISLRSGNRRHPLRHRHSFGLTGSQYRLREKISRNLIHNKDRESVV